MSTLSWGTVSGRTQPPATTPGAA